MTVRITYLVAAVVNLIIMPLLPPHYSPVNLIVVAGFTALAWTDTRVHPKKLHLFLLLACATVTTAVGSVAAERSDSMLYTFLGLCLIFGFIAYNSGKASADEI